MNFLLRLARWLDRLNRPLKPVPYVLLACSLACLVTCLVTGRGVLTVMALGFFFLSLLSALHVSLRREPAKNLESER